MTEVAENKKNLYRNDTGFGTLNRTEGNKVALAFGLTPSAEELQNCKQFMRTILCDTKK